MLLVESGMGGLAGKKKGRFKGKGGFAMMKAIAPDKLWKATKPIMKAGPKAGLKAPFSKDAKSQLLKDQMKTAYVDTVMKSQAAVSPSFDKHYEAELRKRRMKELTGALSQTTDREEFDRIQAELDALGKDHKKYLKTGKLVGAVFSILGMVFPILQIVSAAIALGLKHEGTREQERSQQQLKLAEEQAVREMVAQGLTDAQARAVINMMKQGTDPKTAMLIALQQQAEPDEDAGREQDHRARLPKDWPTNTGVVKPMLEEKKLSKQEAGERFLSWLREWRPDYYARIERERPDLLVVHADEEALQGMDWDTGDYNGLLDGLGQWGEWIGAIGTAVSNVAGSVIDYQTAQAQLKQLRNQQPPLTPAQQQAQQNQRAAQTQGQGKLPGWVLPAGLLGVAGLIFMALRRR